MLFTAIKIAKKAKKVVSGARRAGKKATKRVDKAASKMFKGLKW
ncbi:MAG: hypothetical protein P0Y55_11955 [Candidatus Cohnella colombiensis]|uniref:Uncharacterized protein n=1 Tax=Candidatus Cohnella colombiensis TaxID=3121368 RepID=A0AA95JAU4_9BACL|nr:MAG: hypothetical protein P0Y55_11955 [Cohnella sp.]